MVDTVAFITFCHSKDIHRLHSPGQLDKMIGSHHYNFDQVSIIHQRCKGINYELDIPASIHESEDYPEILRSFNISESKRADEMTHGVTGPHYWKWHVINHLIGLLIAKTDYIVFSDSDCRMVNQPSDHTWIDRGIELLKKYNNILIVSPGDGGHISEKTIEDVRLTKNVSQQLFLCERKKLAAVDFDIPWDWEFLAPGEPFQEYYYLLEGRLWRYMEQEGLWRSILSDRYRYWHDQW